MKFLLYIKPWILFLIFIIGSIIPTDSFYGLIIDLPIAIISVGWMHQIGITMYNLIPEKLKPNIRYFNFCCWSILILIVILSIQTMLNPLSIKVSDFKIQAIFFLPVGLYLLWSLLYASMFAARMLESVIEGKIVNRSDSLKGFVCFMIFPIGVWYIQPAVQRVLSKYEPAKSQPAENN